MCTLHVDLEALKGHIKKVRFSFRFVFGTRSHWDVSYCHTTITVKPQEHKI